MLVWDVKEDRSSLPQASATKPGQEPLLIILLGPDNNINSLTVCSDGVKICQATALADGVLTLIAVYFLVNLNYPNDYSQLLGFIQLLCLQIDFPPQLRSTAFTTLKESLCL